MKHRLIIITSTVVALALALTLAFFWLCKTRYINLSTDNAESVDDEIYSRVEKTLEKKYGGKYFFSVKADEVKAELEKDPYVSSVKVETVFPDKLNVTFTERKERFAVAVRGERDEYLITDGAFVLLRVTTDKSLLHENLVEVNVKNQSIDTGSLPLGKRISFDKQDVFGAMTDVFLQFDDRLNFIDKIIIYGSENIDVTAQKNAVDFETVTGVTINVSFACGTSVDPTEREQAETVKKIIAKAKEIQESYDKLDELSMSEGYVRVYENSDGEIKIKYESPSETKGKETC